MQKDQELRRKIEELENKAYRIANAHAEALYDYGKGSMDFETMKKTICMRSDHLAGLASEIANLTIWK